MNPSWKSYELALLALVIWREARGEGARGMLAVGFSIMNRVKHPGWWGTDLIGVIAKKWQYSSMTAPGDPQLGLYPQSGDASFDAALSAAEMIIDGTASNLIADATNYYDDSIPAPKWATPETWVVKIGRLNFHTAV